MCVYTMQSSTPLPTTSPQLSIPIEEFENKKYFKCVYINTRLREEVRILLIYIYVKRKVRIRTILGFFRANLGSELWRNNPRIARANIGSADLLRKPRIHMQSSRIAQPNLGHPRQQTHDRSRKRSSSAIRRNEATTYRARKAVRPSATKKSRMIAHAKQLAHPRQRSTFDRAVAHALRLCRQHQLRINKSIVIHAIKSADGRDLVSQS